MMIWAGGFWISVRSDRRQAAGITPPLMITVLWVTRNLPLFVVAALEELDAYVGRGLRALRDSGTEAGRRRIRIAVASTLGLFLGVGIALSVPWRWDRTAGSPVREVPTCGRIRARGTCSTPTTLAATHLAVASPAGVHRRSHAPPGSRT